MAVFRVDKTRGYTVMSNHHLHNRNLSFKAKGLLSFMLSLPEDWNYTERGLSQFAKDGRDSIRAALSELECKLQYVNEQKVENKNVHLSYCSSAAGGSRNTLLSFSRYDGPLMDMTVE